MHLGKFIYKTIHVPGTCLFFNVFRLKVFKALHRHVMNNCINSAILSISFSRDSHTNSPINVSNTIRPDKFVEVSIQPNILKKKLITNQHGDSLLKALAKSKKFR